TPDFIVVGDVPNIRPRMTDSEHSIAKCRANEPVADWLAVKRLDLGSVVKGSQGVKKRRAYRRGCCSAILRRLCRLTDTKGCGVRFVPFASLRTATNIVREDTLVHHALG